EIRRDTEIVLNESAAQRAAALRILSAALDEAVRVAHQEIGPRIAAVGGASEAELSVLAEGVDQVDLHPHHIPPDGDFVPAANPVNAVGEVEVLTVERARMSGAHAEIARNLDDDLRRIGGRDGHSQAGKTVRGAAQDCAVNPVEGKDEAVEQRGPDIV